MSNEKDEITKLSEQFLDLWQRQLSATMKNPDMIASMMQAMHQMQQQMGHFYASTKTPAADTGLFEPGDDELRELDRRLRACEKRLDKLESGAKTKG